MPENMKAIVESASHWWAAIFQSALFALVGLSIGLGQLLNSKETLTARVIIGRCLSTAGLAMASGAVLAWMPGVPPLAQIGIAATLASLGTSGLERIVQRLAQGRVGE